MKYSKTLIILLFRNSDGSASSSFIHSEWESDPDYKQGVRPEQGSGRAGARTGNQSAFTVPALFQLTVSM